MKTTAGDTLTYTAMITATSRGVFTWALTEDRDLDGNEVEYHYTQKAGEYIPSEIDYTLGHGGTPRKVTFNWEPRSTAGAANILHYLAGLKLYTTVLLTDIKTWVGTQQVRDYHLHYKASPATARPLVDWVRVCAYDGSGQHCFNPTTFSYQGEHAPAFRPVDAADLGLYPPNGEFDGACSLSASVPALLARDLNGDGLQDILTAFGSLDPFQTRDYRMQFGDDNDGIGFKPQGPPRTAFQELSEGSAAIDFNLDGRTDATVEGIGEGDTHPIDLIYLSPAPATVIEKPSGASIVWHPFVNGVGPIVPFSFEVGDFNGDGKPDFVTFDRPSGKTIRLEVDLAYGSGNNTMYSPASSYTRPTTWVGNTGGRPNARAVAQVIDYDADGLSDLIGAGPNDSDYTLLHNVNGQFVSEATDIPYIDMTNSARQVTATFVDINGDSLPDALVPRYQSSNQQWEWYIYPNTGDAAHPFGTPQPTGIQAPLTQRINDGGGIMIPNSGGWILSSFVKTVHDPDGGTDIIFPTARTYFAHDYKHCIERDPGHGGKPCARPFTHFGSCGGIGYNDWRNDYPAGIESPWPTGRDGYSWQAYRAQGGSFELTAMGGELDHNLGPGGTLDFNNDGLSDVLGVAVTVAPRAIRPAARSPTH